MTPNIDAEGIDALVAAWPSGIVDRTSLHTVATYNRKLAYDAAVGSGLAWLADKHKQAVLWPLDPGGMCMCSYDRLPRKNESGTHHLAAVSAAVLAAAKGGA